MHSAVYGFEAGYNIKLLGLLTIHPQMGVGNDETSVRITPDGGSSSSQSKGYLYLEPAGLVMISIGIVYVGADVGALLLPSGPYGAARRAKSRRAARSTPRSQSMARSASRSRKRASPISFLDFAHAQQWHDEHAAPE